MPAHKAKVLPAVLASDTICFDSMFVNTDDLSISTTTINFEPPICTSIKEKNSFGGYPLIDVSPQITNSTEIRVYSNYYWYPYDQLSMPLSIQTNYRLLKEGSVYDEDSELSLIIPVRASDNQGWEVSVHSETLKDPFNREYNTATVLFSRPVTIRIIVPVLFAVFVTFTGILSMEKKDAFLEGAVALFVGIIGINQIIFPSALTKPVFLDTALLGLYALFVIPLVFHVIAYFQVDKLEKYRLDQQIISDEDLLKSLLNNDIVNQRIRNGVERSLNKIPSKRRRRLSSYWQSIQPKTRSNIRARRIRKKPKTT